MYWETGVASSSRQAEGPQNHTARDSLVSVSDEDMNPLDAETN